MVILNVLHILILIDGGHVLCDIIENNICAMGATKNGVMLLFVCKPNKKLHTLQMTNKWPWHGKS